MTNKFGHEDERKASFGQVNSMVVTRERALMDHAPFCECQRIRSCSKSESSAICKAVDISISVQTNNKCRQNLPHVAARTGHKRASRSKLFT